MNGEQIATPTVGAAGGVADEPARVQRVLERLAGEQRGIFAVRGGDERARAERADRLAVLAEQRQALWEELARWVYVTAGSVPWVFGWACGEAAETAASDARFWAETAVFWRDRAAGRAGDDGTGRGCG